MEIYRIIKSKGELRMYVYQYFYQKYVRRY